MLTGCYTAIHTPVDDDLGNDFNANDRINVANKHQALDELAFPLSKLQLFEERKCYRFCHFILATKISNPSSGFYVWDHALLRRRQPSIPG